VMAVPSNSIPAKNYALCLGGHPPTKGLYKSQPLCRKNLPSFRPKRCVASQIGEICSKIDFCSFLQSKFQLFYLNLRICIIRLTVRDEKVGTYEIRYTSHALFSPNLLTCPTYYAIISAIMKENQMLEMPEIDTVIKAAFQHNRLVSRRLDMKQCRIHRRLTQHFRRCWECYADGYNQCSTKGEM